MANVIFKRGLQTNLNSIAKEDGVFYLTTDTGRLYVDIDNERKLLNQTVQFVGSITELMNKSAAWTTEAERNAHINDLYYVTGGSSTNNGGGNILCVFTNAVNENGGWVQINPDTDTYVNSGAFTIGTIVNNSSDITLTLEDQKGSTRATATFAVTGTGGITLSQTGNNLEINSQTYTLSNTATNDIASISLNGSLPSGSSTAISTISFANSNGNVTLSTTSNNTIIIDTKDTKLKQDEFDLTLPSDGSLQLSVGDDSGNSYTSTLSNVGVSLNDNSYIPLVSTAGKTPGAVYSKAEIDTMLNGLDGMTFKGTVGASGATVAILPTTGVKNGDTYIVAENHMAHPAGMSGGDASTDVIIGDMFIASGTETVDSQTGVSSITSGLTWNYVPSGNDSLEAVTYRGLENSSNNQFSLVNEAGATVASVSFAGGTGIEVTSTASSTSVMATTITHSTYSTSSVATTSTNATEFTVVKSITVDNGHVVRIDTDYVTPAEYNLTGASTTAISAFSTTANVGTNAVDVEIGLIDSTGSEHASAIMNLNSSTIKLTAGSNGAVAMNLEWGSF